MLDIDGSKKGGSGTILRVAVALSAITKQPLHIFNIRQNRPQPGLKPQHLEAVLTAAKLCSADLEGARTNSRELWFTPKEVRGGRFEAEIGTAGSIPMLLMTILPICAHAQSAVHVHVSKGGTDVSHSPTINYMRFVALPILRRMGLNATMEVQKYGYYPKGNGEINLTIEPTEKLTPIRLEEFGNIRTMKGMSVCTFLDDRKVAERQAKAANQRLKEEGCTADIQVVNDKSNPLQKGSSITLWAETDTGAIIGADAIGELKKASEKVGDEAAQKLLEEIRYQPTVDLHLADLLIPYVALAQGKSVFLARAISEHLETNIWLAEEILGTSFKIEKTGKLYRIERN